jgi:hypothetical protein
MKSRRCQIPFVFWAAILATLILFDPKSCASSLTNGLVAYWPMDQIIGGAVTPDLGPNSFDLKPYFGGNNAMPTNFNGTNIQLVQGVHSNAMSFNAGQQTMLAYISGGYPGLMPPILMTNFTISFWVKADLGSAGSSRTRVFSCADTNIPGVGGDTLWDVEIDPANGSQVTHFVRQAPTLSDGVQYGDFNSSGQTTTCSNATVFDSHWHNITIVQQTVTNRDAPVLSATNLIPVAGSVTVSWNSATLDSLTNALNAPSQVDTNQNYLVQKAVDPSGSWTTIATVGSNGNGTSQFFTDVNATNSAAFYRVIKPAIRLLKQTVYVDVTNVLGPDWFGQPMANGAAYRLNGPFHANAISFGGIMRFAPTGWSTCLIDDAAIWNRALTTDEINAYVQGPQIIVVPVE